MRKLFLALALLPALAACTVGQIPPVTPITSVLPKDVQDAAVRVCGFLPAAETVAALIAAFGGPAVPGVASQIAREVCEAVAPRPSSLRRAGVPTVRGVPIKGEFVR
jgi:hypothetical protein